MDEYTVGSESQVLYDRAEACELAAELSKLPSYRNGCQVEMFEPFKGGGRRYQIALYVMGEDVE